MGLVRQLCVGKVTEGAIINISSKIHPAMTTEKRLRVETHPRERSNWH